MVEQAENTAISCVSCMGQAKATYTAQKREDGKGMKIIRLTYRDAEIKPSVYLLLFFRFAGIYVYERFWGPRTVQMEEPELSQRDQDKDQEEMKDRRLAVFTAYDCDIYIVRDEADFQEYEKLADKKPERTVLLTRGQLADDSINYESIIEYFLVNQICDNLANRGIILPDEAAELKMLASVYDKEKLTQITLGAKYFFAVIEKPQLSMLQGKYEAIISALLNNLVGMKCIWGDRRFFHMQYATLNMIYELNCLCVRYQEELVYSKESLLRLCDALETGLDGLLGDSVKMLKGQVYDDLFQNPNAAYERYVNCCNSDSTYNSYVYLRKGNYWQDFGEDWEQALKYYTQAVYIYPEYYRAWFKIGLCNRKLGRNREAVTAYENVRRCLSDRIAGKCVRPMEMEHIFKAQVQIAEIWEKNGNQDNAIEALWWAERIWDLAENTSFYALMSMTPSEEEFYRKKTKENLDIESVYERLIVLNTIAGNRDEVLRYREKLS